MTLLLSVVILATLLPVFLWHRTRPLGPFLLVLYAGYCYLVRDWLYGDMTVCHDMYQGYQFYFNITRQWVQSETEFGWNPYLGAGQPLSVMSNLLFWVPAVLLAKAEMLFDVSLRPYLFSNLVTMSILFFYASGMALLLQLLFKNFWVTFFGVSSFVGGGMLIYNLHQFWPALFAYPLTYALFFLFHSYKSKSWPGLYLLALFSGSIANHYIPLYFYLTLLFVLIGLWMVSPQRMKKWLRAIGPIKRWPSTLLCLVLFILVASPANYNFMEMQDYVGPSRGFSDSGAITSKGSIEHLKALSAPPMSYMTLLQPGWVSKGSSAWHTSAYLGVIPCFLLLAFLPITLKKDKNLRAIAIAVGLMVFLGLGNNTPVWEILGDHIPLFDMLRYPAGFASAATLPILVLSAGCLNQVLKLRSPGFGEAILMVLGAGVFIVLASLEPFSFTFGIKTLLKGPAVGIVTLALMALVIVGYLKRFPIRIKGKNISQNVMTFALTLLALANLVELGAYTKSSIKLSPLNEKMQVYKNMPKYSEVVKRERVHSPRVGLCKMDEYELAPMVYPLTWVSRCDTCLEDVLPFMITPVINKEIIWTHLFASYMFLLPKKFGETYQQLLASLNWDDKVMEGDLFYLVPNADGWDYSLNDFEKLDSIPQFSVIRIHPPEEWDLGIVTPISSKNPNQISVRINAKKNAYLQRMENFHSGWKARLDGQEVQIDSTDLNFQILPVPKGEHVIEFTFESGYGLVARLAFWTIMAGLLVSGFLLLRIPLPFNLK